MLYTLNSAKSAPAIPLGPGSAEEQPWMKPQPKKRGTPAFDPQRKDGQRFKSKTGVNIRYAWSRAADGCSNDRCDKGFAHICEWCRAPHKTIDCPHSPGWTPEMKDKGRQKGRGKGNPPKRQKHM